MKTGVAIDLGTSGFRAQKVDLESGEIRKTVITMRNPIPGANVMDHLDFAVHYGQDLAHGLMINAFRNILNELGVDTSLERLAICGNPIQLSLFQGIPIDDLAYAGQRKKERDNIKEQERNARIVAAAGIPGLDEFGDCQVFVPPAIKHEVGADALALILKSGMLEKDEISMATDYGTNAEMALKVNDVIYTGSAAAGPALEGQEISQGTIARPFSISDVAYEGKNVRNFVLNEAMDATAGDLVDPESGDVADKGDIEATGITGTGVIALIEEAIKSGLVVLPGIKARKNVIHLQDNITFTEDDLKEAGRAIGALRAGHIALCNTAGIGMEDIGTAYMSGAAGTYMDALKAHAIGMAPFNANRICQIGNTSLAMARDILLSEERLWELQSIAKEIVGTHVMFATDQAFKDAYILELSYWGEGMPFKVLKKYLKKQGLPTIDVAGSTPEVEKWVEKDIPILGEEGLHVLDQVGTYLQMYMEGCELCKKCVNVCPNDALSLEEKTVRIRTDLCDGAHCQKCIHACPPGVLDWAKLEVAA